MNFNDCLKNNDENPLLKIDVTFKSYLNSYNRSFKNHLVGNNLDYVFDSDFAVRQKIAGLSGWGKFSKTILAEDIPAEMKFLHMNFNQVGSLKYPEVYNIAKKCSQRLELNLPTVFVREDIGKPIIYSLVSNTIDPCVVISKELVQEYSSDELTFAVGSEFGKIQNNHCVYNLACNYIFKYHAMKKFSYNIPMGNQLEYSLQEWMNFGDITADRAAMVCLDNPHEFPNILAQMYKKGYVDGYGRSYPSIDILGVSLMAKNIRVVPARDIYLSKKYTEIEKRLLCAYEFLSCESLYSWRKDIKCCDHYVTGQVCDVRCNVILSSEN